MDPVLIKKIIKITSGNPEEIDDSVAVEKRLTLLLNGHELVSLSCSPGMIMELVIGFLLTEGIIRENICPDTIKIIPGEDIVAEVITDADLSLKKMVKTSGCGGGVAAVQKEFTQISDQWILKQEDIEKLFRHFYQGAELFRLTGCVHSAALSDGDTLLVLAEDIGRHNAVDKVLGHCILRDISFRNTLMLVSGRLSSEMVSKCARWKIPMLASRTAPTSLAIEIAEKAGITLIGFMRGKRMNVYTHAQRIAS